MGLERAAQSTVSARQRNRLGRSIAQTQLLASAAVLLLSWIVLMVQPRTLADPLFYGGVLLVFIVSGATLLISWNESNRRFSAFLPAVDIVAFVAIREGAPELGAGLFLVIPVLWLARNFRVTGAVGGVALSTALIWIAWATRGNPIVISDFPGLILLPITLSFVATTAYIGGRRSSGQRTLLRQQAQLVENAFDRARRQEVVLDEILNAVEFGVIAFDRDGQVTLMNDAHRRSLAEFGAPRSAIVHPIAYQADRVTPYPPHNRPFERAIAGQSFDNLTFWVGPPGDHQVAYSVTSRRLTTLDGDADGGVLVVRDVTAELDAIRARDSLIASVSHELRTPLTSIIGYLELALEDPAIDDETRRMIDISFRNSERLFVLVTDLLLAASDADTTLPISLVTADISEIVHQAVEAHRLLADERSITVHTDIEESVVTQADPVRIRQVVDNLLTNATKYNRENGDIFVAVASTGGEVRVSVRDTGLGISEADQAQLFDRFFRAESARRSNVSGSGLGLSITRDIVRQHGGDLSVSSALGTGSVFTMTIPTETAP
jgi:two-component system phosphate regulon sensor histidine kinase PhoR